MGTGMAFPWQIIHSAELASGAIVEDLKLGLDLAAEGRAPLFCPAAVISSLFPTTIAGTRAQRERWEQGQLGLMATRAIPLLYKSAKQRNLQLMALALDLLVPPLSLLLATLTLAVAIAGFAFLSVGWVLPFAISVGCFVLASLAIIIDCTRMPATFSHCPR